MIEMEVGPWPIITPAITTSAHYHLNESQQRSRGHHRATNTSNNMEKTSQCILVLLAYSIASLSVGFSAAQLAGDWLVNISEVSMIDRGRCSPVDN